MVARELQCSLLDMRLSEVARGELGAGERRVREIFASARKRSPAVLFIDEFQALFASGLSTLSAALAGCFDDIESWNSCMGTDRLVQHHFY